MQKEIYCQRCAMKMEKPEDFGTNADGSKNEEYCCYCYENGAFCYPKATMEEVIESCIEHVVPDIFPDEAAARKALTEHFPTLKCWKKTGMIISFKLKEGVSVEDFLSVSDEVQEKYLSKCKGFISRQLMIIDGIWTDWVIWETLPDAENAMMKSEENETAQKFFPLIGEMVEEQRYTLERAY